MFAERTKYLKSSVIRETLKYSEDPEMISFAGGLPNPHTFPKKEILKLAKDVIANRPTALQYGPTEGVKELREALVKRSKNYGIKTDLENLIITTGSQQSLFLLAEILIDHGDKIAVESPTYLGALNAFSVFRPEYIGIEMDHDGMKVDILEEHLRAGEKIKFVYTIPTFQNPAGTKMTEDRRKHLLELAEKHDFLIVEDDPYSELNYSGKEIRSIKSMDNSDRVVYLSTFSKILCPGFRLGWIIGRKDIIEKMSVAKQAADLCSGNFVQYIAAEYLERNIIDKQVKLIRKTYKQKRDLMLAALEKHFSDIATWTKPEGGMFLWLEFHKSISVFDLFEYAIKEKVLFIPGAPFYAVHPKYNTMRLNFTNTDDELIEEGIARLAHASRKFLK
jgi:2-aminoadipate transaminase